MTNTTYPGNIRLLIGMTNLCLPIITRTRKRQPLRSSEEIGRLRIPPSSHSNIPFHFVVIGTVTRGDFYDSTCSKNILRVEKRPIIIKM